MPSIRSLLNAVSILYLLVMAGYLSFAFYGYSNGEVVANDILTTLKEQGLLILGVVLGMIKAAADKAP